MSGGAFVWLALEHLYRLERSLPERNFAKDHSFEEWLEQRSGGSVK